MALQHDIKALIDAGRLPEHWTANDLRGEPSLTEQYSDTYLATHPANRSEPIAGMPQLGVGNHIANGATALFLRVGMRDGALLFALQDQGMEERTPIPQRNIVEDAVDLPDECENDLHDDLGEGRIAETHNWSENGDAWLSSNETVKALVEMMNGLLGSGPPVAHCYHHIKGGYDWQCSGLLDAAAKYRFPVVNYKSFGVSPERPRDSLAANHNVLSKLQSDLRNARITANEKLAVDTAIDILIWGGTNSGNHNSNAVIAASGKAGGFLGYLDLCDRSFGTGTSVDLTPFIGSPHRVRSNAGFTKIYSLAFDNFVIYDSRVAAALGLLVVRFRATQGFLNAAVPGSIAFAILGHRGSGARRDPNSNRLRITGFPLLVAGNHCDHLKWNIRANALLSGVITGTNFEAQVKADPARFPADPLRVLEAALFMVGYDLGGNWPHYN